MKRTLTILFLCLTVSSFGQKNKGQVFNIEDFNKKFEIVEWLYNYDMVAWWTSDSVMVQDKEEIERLGNEWFCFEGENNSWHAVYGNFENNHFDLVFHYTVDNKGYVKRIYDKIDTLLLNSYSRALITANNQLTRLKDTVNLSFNQFIKQNADKSFSVWILPAFQPNSYAIYGGEFIYKIDETGNKILSDDSYFQGQFRGFKVDNPREIWLNYIEVEKPTLGGIFFVWYYKTYFTKIIKDKQKSKSTLFQNEDKSYYWVHAEKEIEKDKKKK